MPTPRALKAHSLQLDKVLPALATECAVPRFTRRVQNYRAGQDKGGREEEGR
jgi:hypothetical protein